MLRRLVLLCVALGLGPWVTPLWAGAWMRETGSTFVSVGARISWPQDLTTTGERYDTLFLEYGLTPNVTVGLDLGDADNGDDKRLAFVQVPLWQPEAGWRASASLGLGQIGGDRVVRPGLSLGRGTENRYGYGWQAGDISLEYYPAQGTLHRKLDLTWGMALPKDRRLVLQLQSGVQDGDPAYVRFVPSIVLPVTGTVFAQVGATYGLTGDDTFGAITGLWMEF